MLTDKRMLSDADLESQAALELPDREMLLVTIVITNLLNNLSVEVDVRNVNVAAQICANLIASGKFACENSLVVVEGLHDSGTLVQEGCNADVECEPDQSGRGAVVRRSLRRRQYGPAPPWYPRGGWPPRRDLSEAAASRDSARALARRSCSGWTTPGRARGSPTGRPRE